MVNRCKRFTSIYDQKSNKTPMKKIINIEYIQKAQYSGRFLVRDLKAKGKNNCLNVEDVCECNDIKKCARGNNSI